MSDALFHQWIQRWQENQPGMEPAYIPLSSIRTSGQAAQFAREALETRGMLETVSVRSCSQVRDNPILRLFRDRFLPAIRRNSNLRHLLLADFEFSISAAEGFISFLDSASNLTYLKLLHCSDSSETKHIATVLQRNTNIQTLCVDRCDDDFLIPIFQKLASPQSTSQLLNIHYDHRYRALPPTAPLTEAMQRYFESGSATTRCFGVDGCIFGEQNGLYNLLECLMHRNTPVNEVSFNDCVIDHEDGEDLDGDDEDEAEHVSEEENQVQLANFIRNMRSGNVGKVSTLRITYCNFFQVQEVFNAVTEVLVNSQSTLHVFAFSVNDDTGTSMPLAKFQDIMAAAAHSTRLEHLIIDFDIEFENTLEHFESLKTAIPSFKFKELTLLFNASSEGDEEEQLLEAFKRNYSLQNIEFTVKETGNHWFREQNQSRLDFYLHRNRKLAEWVENPKLVPRDLWTYALKLALTAGKDRLYQSLLSLSGHGIASQQGKRKRKRRQLYDPSPSLAKRAHRA